MKVPHVATLLSNLAGDESYLSGARDEITAAFMLEAPVGISDAVIDDFNDRVFKNLATKIRKSWIRRY